MPFPKGKSGNPRGRKVGAVNKTTATAKQAFQDAFEQLGGMAGMVKWAKADPDNLDTFYTLYARLIPLDVTSGGDRLPTLVINAPAVTRTEINEIASRVKIRPLG